MTKSQFIKDSQFTQVSKAVINQLGGWSDFKDCAQDIANYGIDGGFHGFIYYTDTIKFYKKNKKAIIAMAQAQCSDFGYSSVSEMIASFNSIDLSAFEVEQVLMGNNKDDETQVFNVLAWCAAEEVSRSYADMMEGE